MTHNPHIKCDYKGVYTHIHFLRRAQKASPEPPRTQSIRCALMPLTRMSHPCRFRCVMVPLVFNISAKSWRNATVQGRASISQTTPTTTSTHLGPKFTAPRPLHLRSGHCPPNWCQRPCYLTSRLWLRPDHHEMHSESNLDARNKRVNSSLQKRISGAAIPQSKIMTHNPHIKCDYKRACFKPHLPHLYTHPFFWDGLKKPLQNHREENQSVVPWCLWHRYRKIADSDGWWYGWSSTSQPAPGRMRLCNAGLRFHRRLAQHLLTLDPSPPHLGPCITALIARQIDVNDRVIWLQGCRQGLATVQNIQRTILMPAEKGINFNALISKCLDLKEGVSIQPFWWCTTPNQNKCKFIEDHIMPNIE